MDRRRRLDTITVEDMAGLVREPRREGKAERTIAGVIKAANRTFKSAKRRMNWHGQNPVVRTLALRIGSGFAHVPVFSVRPGCLGRA